MFVQFVSRMRRSRRLRVRLSLHVIFVNEAMYVCLHRTYGSNVHTWTCSVTGVLEEGEVERGEEERIRSVAIRFSPDTSGKP